MISNILNAARGALLKKAYQNDSKLIKSRKILIMILALWLGLRLPDIVSSFVFNVLLEKPVYSYILTAISLLVVLVFIFTMLFGYKTFTYLSILSGAQMILYTVINIKNALLAHQAGDLLFMTVYILTAFGGVSQIILMIVILLNKDCTYYFKKMAGIHQQTSGEKQHHE